MDAEMGETPSTFNTEDLSSRQQYRRYRKRESTTSMSPILGNSVARFLEARPLHGADSIQRRSNAALLLEEIKQEAEHFDDDTFDETTPKLMSFNERISIDGPTVYADVGSLRKGASRVIKSGKHEDEASIDGVESTYTLFASLFDSALQGLMPFSDLILQFENTCRIVSESIRYGSFGRHRAVEDKLMQQKARVLLDEAASWSLLWYLFGKATEEEFPENLILFPSTSHQEACQFVTMDLTAQLCLRIVLWLEGLSSKALDLEKKLRGSHVGSYVPSSGVWHHTQRFLKRKKDDSSIVKHLDFDALTRESAHVLPDDKKQNELLFEDIWTLIRAGRLEEACELCRSAGQPWRAASLIPFGGLDQFPSVEAVIKNGKSRVLQAIELESGIGRQLRLWKWACYCSSEKISEQDGEKYEMALYASQCSNLKRVIPICKDWESACWALTKSWLDVQVDLVLAQSLRTGAELKRYMDNIDVTSDLGGHSSLSSNGPENWPCHVIDQQPRDLPSLLQKLNSCDIVGEAVSRACKEQHRLIEMKLMTGDIAHLLDLIWSWLSSSDDDQGIHADHQMVRFGAHLVLVLRYLLDNEMKDAFRQKLNTVGDRILQMYAMLLFSMQHEELVGVYVSQLDSHICIDLFVNMLEQKLNDSIHVKYKLFLSVMEYLPFSSNDKAKASFEDVIDRVLARSREIVICKYDEKSFDVAEQHRLQSLQKAMAIQWLCFTPPSSITNSEAIKAKLLIRALMHSNILFRDFGLISMRRVPKMPIGAHTLLSFLAEPLKQPKENLDSFGEYDVTEYLNEFEDWHEYYSCDATYRNWLQIELINAQISPSELTVEEKERANATAREALKSSLSFLTREDSSWLIAAHDALFETAECIYLDLRAIGILSQPSGDCISPDATLCTSLTSALYSSVTEQDVLKRDIMINVCVSSRDRYCVEISLRCLAVNGDGLGIHVAHDGGILANIMASAFKGELNRFQAEVILEISCIDAWYSGADGSLLSPATFIIKGLCHRCCLPEMVLRCMQMSVSLAYSGDSFDWSNVLIELVASSQSGMLHLFSQHQLQEFLMFERESSLYRMEFREEVSADDS